MWLLAEHGLPWPLVALLVIIGGVLVGVLNGVLVEFGQIDSFIATLGTGSVLYALTGWITGGGRIVPGPQGLPASFTDLTNSSFLGLPVTFFYVVILVIVLWLTLEHLPLGRYLYVVGANPRAADLVGIPRRRIVIYAFIGSGVVTAIAGVLLAAQQQIGDPSAGSSYLLPAFVGALLGSTTIKPGRANAIGTLVAVAILAIGLSGLQQEGAAFWVTPLFNGLTLLAAVGLAGFASRRRQRAGAVIGAASRPAPSPPRPRNPTRSAPRRTDPGTRPARVLHVLIAVPFPTTGEVMNMRHSASATPRRAGRRRWPRRPRRLFHSETTARPRRGHRSAAGARGGQFRAAAQPRRPAVLQRPRRHRRDPGSCASAMSAAQAAVAAATDSARPGPVRPPVRRPRQTIDCLRRADADQPRRRRRSQGCQGRGASDRLGRPGHRRPGRPSRHRSRLRSGAGSEARRHCGRRIRPDSIKAADHSRPMPRHPDHRLARAVRSRSQHEPRSCSRM